MEEQSFSYADPKDPPFKRALIQAIERMSGQPYLRWLYENYRAKPGENFWDGAVRLLELTLHYDESRLAAWPRQGALVVVCNHPFGVIDGIAAAAIVGRVRPDFKVLTNAVICKAEPLRNYLLPIDFNETEEALQTNLRSRQYAIAHLKSGGSILIFPAGGVSTTPHWLARTAIDTEWKTFTARLITQAKASVVPLYFAGQNSRLFQLASQVSLTLRLALLFHEVHNKIGSTVQAVPGDVLPYEVLAAEKDRKKLMQRLCAETYGLARLAPPFAARRTKRPKTAPPPGTAAPGQAGFA